MPAREAPGDYIYHVLNRAIPGVRIFESPKDYRAFEEVLAEACKQVPMRILAYCLMPNHWHLVLWPYNDGDLAKFMHWLTNTHAHRWRELRGSVGRGHLYQGRYRSFPVKGDDHLLRLCRYVERNAKRAGLVERAERWRWCSLWRRLHPVIDDSLPTLTEWPVTRCDDWIEYVNETQADTEVQLIRVSLTRGRPLGPADWQAVVAKQLGLEKTLKSLGRPPKNDAAGEKKGSRSLNR